MKKLHLLCAKDDLRPTLNHVKVTREVCVATDAHILAAVPTELMFDNDFISQIPEQGVLIHHEDWRKMCAGIGVAWKSEDVLRVIMKSGKRDVLIEVESESEVGKYPNWEDVVPRENMREDVGSIGINAKFAATLQDALDWPSLKLSFNGVSRAMTVSNARDDSEGITAIIMPIITLP